MSIREELSDLRLSRLDIGVNILEEMKKENEFPISISIN